MSFIRGLLSLILLFANFALGAPVPADHAYRGLLHLEQSVNDRESSFLATGVEGPGIGIGQSDFAQMPPAFDPVNAQMFAINYLLIPIADAPFLRAGESDRSLEVVRDGKTYLRFFIHPLMEKYYTAEVQKYGPLQSGWVATPTSSPRSLILRNLANPNEYRYEKIGLDVDIGGVTRVNSMDKLIRAVTVSKVLASIKEDLKARGIFYLSEAEAIRAPFHNDGNISRQLPFAPQHSNGAPTMIPAFSLFAKDPVTGEAMLLKLIAASGMTAEQYLEKMVIGPLVRSHAYLAMQHGLIHEAHVQNILYVADAEGRLTGQIVYRDLDSIKTDFEMRKARGLSLDFYRDVSDPRETFQADKAIEYYDNSFIKYLRGDWGNRIERAFGVVRGQNSYLREDRMRAWGLDRLSDWYQSLRRRKKSQGQLNFNVFEMFDRLQLVETVRHLGSQSALVLGKPSTPITPAFGINQGVENFKERHEVPNLAGLAGELSPRGLPKHALGNGADIEIVPTKTLTVGQRILGSDQVLRWAREEVAGEPEKFVFDVVKGGTRENPFYQLLDGHHRAFVIQVDHRPRSWKVRVTEDLTALPVEEQHKILQQRGFFWDPQTGTDQYVRMGFYQMRQSFWRSLYSRPELCAKFSGLAQDDGYMKELIFGRKLFELLQAQNLHPYQLSEAQAVSALFELPNSALIIRARPSGGGRACLQMHQ